MCYQCHVYRTHQGFRRFKSKYILQPCPIILRRSSNTRTFKHCPLPATPWTLGCSLTTSVIWANDNYSMQKEQFFSKIWENARIFNRLMLSRKLWKKKGICHLQGGIPSLGYWTKEVADCKGLKHVSCIKVKPQVPLKLSSNLVQHFLPTSFRQSLTQQKDPEELTLFMCWRWTEQSSPCEFLR